MRLILIVLSSLISFGAPLTVQELDGVRQRASAGGVVVTYTKQQANSGAQAAQTWIETNRGALPNKVVDTALTGPQRTAVTAAMGGVLKAGEKVAIFNAVGDLHEIVPPAPLDPLDAAITAARQALIQLFNTAIDNAQPGLSNAEKRRAVRMAIDSL